MKRQFAHLPPSSEGNQDQKIVPYAWSPEETQAITDSAPPDEAAQWATQQVPDEAAPRATRQASKEAWSYVAPPENYTPPPPAANYTPPPLGPIMQRSAPFVLPPPPVQNPQVQPESMPWQQPMSRPESMSRQQPMSRPEVAYNWNSVQPPMQPPRPGRPRPGRRRKKRFPTWARIVVALLTILLVALGSGLWYYQANFAGALTKITSQQAALIGKDGQAMSQAVTSNSIGSKRINILLLGSDTDGKNAAPLAQTDIVLTIDPQTSYVGMLSIPRDLRVSIPNNGTGKLDAAFSKGWINEHVGPTPFSNAVGLSIATVEKNFGITIDHYAWVGLNGFVKVINTAGGVDVDATHAITDNYYPDDVSTTNSFAYKRLYIVPGPQHMDGVQALEYVRTRHSDLVGDFGRSARQQQILSQLKTKLDTPDIITRLPELVNDLGDTVKTDMALQDIVNFMGYARNLDPAKINRLVLSPPYSVASTDGTGDFLPNCNLIIPQIAQMFNVGTNATCIQTAKGNTSAQTAVAATQPATITPTALAAVSGSAHATVQLPGLFANAHMAGAQLKSDNLFGVHSLLDLLFMVVFESIDATKV